LSSFYEDMQSVNADFLGPGGLGKSAYLADGTKIEVIEVQTYEESLGVENNSIRIKTLTKLVDHLVHGNMITVESPSEMIEGLVEAETYYIIGIKPGSSGMTTLNLSKEVS